MKCEVQSATATAATTATMGSRGSHLRSGGDGVCRLLRGESGVGGCPSSASRSVHRGHPMPPPPVRGGGSLVTPKIARL